jgi:hypothetical protein
MKTLLLIITLASGSTSVVEVDSMENCNKMKTSIQTSFNSDYGKDLAETAFKIYCIGSK